MKRLAALSLLATTVALGGAAPAPNPAPAKACSDDPKWTDPAEPFRIWGNTWFVGTCGLSSILINSPKGHVLIDPTLEANVPAILANIRKLGFRPRDVKLILFSHAHFDHVGGMKALRAATGARVLGRGDDAAALEAGHGGARDPQRASADPFPPVGKVTRIAAGQVVRLGPLRLTAIDTTGHTPGGTSWTWQSCEARECRQLVYADSVSAVSDNGYRFSDDKAHPGYLAAFRASLARLAALKCDMLLTPHPSVSAMMERFGPLATQPSDDPGACKALAARAGAALDQRLAKEAAGT